MGLFTEGSPLSWAEIVPHLDGIKKAALAQFIHLHQQLKNRERDQLRWGDEIEYVLVHFDREKKKVRVSLRAEELLEELGARETVNDVIGYENRTLWRPEFASYQIEGTPGTPYGGLLESFGDVERNMCFRRAELARLLRDGESLMSISFPALGTIDFTRPPMKMLEELDAGGKAPPGSSRFFSDEMISKSHPRYLYLTRNMFERRGGDQRPMAVNVPIFRDKCTPAPFIEEFADPRVQHQQALPDHIFLDHMGFGTGLCCLQVTLQGGDLDEARWLYDQLAPLTPLMVALSAATPIYRGLLADVDARWDIISQLSDDRTEQESRLEGKTRFGTIDCFIHPSSAPFNDIPVRCDQRTLEQLLAAGVDFALAQHIAHSFIWDPLLAFSENLQNLDSTDFSEHDEMGHFDCIQSSIWSSLRFKPPPSAKLANRLGWRVEFRPMEVQLTDFENAAFCCFLMLITRVLLSDRLSFVMPISLIDQNMERAQRRDAVTGEKLHFRTNLKRHDDDHHRNGAANGTANNTNGTVNNTETNGIANENGTANENGMANENENGLMNGQQQNGEEKTATSSEVGLGIREMSVNEIINGDGRGFPGLVPLCLRWLDAAGDAPLDVGTRALILEYLQFIQLRASGQCATLARWMREFVAAHPDYRRDSQVPDTTIYDMLNEMDQIAKGESRSPRLLAQFGQRNWLLEVKAASNSKWRTSSTGSRTSSNGSA